MERRWIICILIAGLHTPAYGGAALEFLGTDKPHLGTPRTIPSPVPTLAPQNQTKSTGGAGIAKLVCKGTHTVHAYGNGYSENSVGNFEVLIEIDFNARTMKSEGLLLYRNVEISETVVSAGHPSDKEYIEKIKVNRITGVYSGYWIDEKTVPGITAHFSRDGKCSPAPEKLF